MHCRFIQQFLWRSVCGCIFQGSTATNYRWSGKFNYVFVGRLFLSATVKELLQELSYRKQIMRQLCTQYVDGIFRLKYYTIALKSTLRVSQGRWKRNHWIDHTWLAISRVIWRWISSWPWNVVRGYSRSLKVVPFESLGTVRFPIRLS